MFLCLLHYPKYLLLIPAVRFLTTLFSHYHDCGYPTDRKVPHYCLSHYHRHL